MMTLLGIELKNDLTNISEKELEEEFQRLRSLELHKTALSVDAAIAEKRLQKHLNEKKGNLPESVIKDSFKKV
jgi:hypothetical protein